MADSPALVEARRKYREKHRQISVTVTDDIYNIMIKSAASKGISNAEYIRSLILEDHKKLIKKQIKKKKIGES